MDKKVRVLVTIGILIILALGFYFASFAITKFTGYSITGQSVYSKAEQAIIASCLNENNAKFYCSSLSMHCSEQRKLLGDVYSQINYVDCGKESDECEALRGFPAWKIGENTYYGVYNLRNLVELANCKLT